MEKERIILHSDLNNFFASVEIALNPDLKGKAVAVCGDAEERHGIVLAKSEEAKKYRESGYKTIQAKDVQEMKDLNMNSSEYREYKNGLKDAGTKNSEKIDYIGDLDVPVSKKNIMAKNVLKRDVDMSDYNKYGSYEEFDYAYKNPEKYKKTTPIT